MSYQKITSFAVKDTMEDNNPLKVVRGKEFDDEFDAITTAMEAQKGVIANLVTTPPGGIVMYAGKFAPAGFLICDGAPRSRNTYTALFQAIGTTYGGGDGVTTFNVPNLVGRFPYGAPVGQSGGFADAAVISHIHDLGASTSVSINDPGHAHSTTIATGLQPQSGSATQCLTQVAGTITGVSSTGISASASTSVSMSFAGVDGTNRNLPPFLGLSFIIKI